MKKIAELLKILPNNDPIIGARLLEKRDFNELSLLVWSDIQKTQKYQRRKDCPDAYKDIDMDKLLTLNALVDKYNIDSLYGEY